MSNESKLAELQNAGIVAVLRAPSAEVAVRSVDALVAGGISGIEVTYSTPDAATAILQLARRYGQRIYLGAGTLLTAAQVTEAVEAGARFLVSPGTDEQLAAAMLGSCVDVFTGALTPSEVMAAIRLGVDAVKLFPSSLGGPAYLRSLRGPFPAVSFMPTGGVNATNLSDWFAAGAAAVGVGGELCPYSAMTDGRWEEIESIAREFVGALDRCRCRIS